MSNDNDNDMIVDSGAKSAVDSEAEPLTFYQKNSSVIVILVMILIVITVSYCKCGTIIYTTDGGDSTKSDTSKIDKTWNLAEFEKSVALINNCS